MEFKKKFKFSIRKLTVGVVSLSLGAAVLAQPVSLLVQNNVAHAEEATPAAEPKAGKVTIERVDLETRPEIKAGEEFDIKVKWVSDPGQQRLGGIAALLNFDIDTLEYIKSKISTGAIGVATTVNTGKARVSIRPEGSKEVEATFTFKAKRDIKSPKESNYTFNFGAFPAPDGRVRWYTYPDYNGPTPLISSWEGLNADGTISVVIAKKKEEQPDQPKPDQPKPDQPKPDQPKPDQPNPDQPKPDQPKPDQPKPDQPKPDQPKPDQPKPDQPKPDQPKPDQPKPDQPKPDQPKPDQPKPDQPKPDQQGGQDWNPFKPSGEQKDPKQPGKGKLANTGQTTTNAGITGVALAGLALAAMRRRKNR